MNIRATLIFLSTLLATLNCRATAPVAASSPAGDAPALQSQKSAVNELIPWLLNESEELRGIPFSDVISAATGKKIIAFDPNNPIDQRVLKQIGSVLDEALKRMNAPDSVVQEVARVNELSSHFETMLRELLNSTSGLSCDFPVTEQNKKQRSGYPDLKLVDAESKRVFYIDPKLYAKGSRASSFRTFYFEPKVATNKVRDDAVHLIVGIEHEPRSGGHWEFTRWDIVDLSQFKVKLKAEFQGSNRDLYRDEAVIGTSAK